MKYLLLLLLFVGCDRVETKKNSDENIDSLLRMIKRLEDDDCLKISVGLGGDFLTNLRADRFIAKVLKLKKSKCIIITQISDLKE